jgi:catechol 2,3-dioxygenase-like lactoylglutathione lyase family enzyme
MDWKIEVVPVPVADYDRAKAFYEQIGFVVDLDTMIGEGQRLVQLTPPGSGCSIHLGDTVAAAAPGSLQGVMIVVDDIDAVRADLVERGVGIGEVYHYEDGQVLPGKGGIWNSFLTLTDPDGNSWLLQERPAPA